MEQSDLDYIDKIFSTQRIFFSDEFPIISPTNKYGDEILRTRKRQSLLLGKNNLLKLNFDDLTWDNKRKLWKNNYNYYSSKEIYSMSKYYSILDRKYLMGEIIDDNIKNPIIVSYNEKRVQVTPGKTRFWCHEYLNLRPKKVLIQIRNEVFNEGMFDYNVIELKKIEEVLKLFVPRKDVKYEDLIFRFTPTKSEIRRKINYELHDATDTPILRPLDIVDRNTSKSVYQHHDNDEKMKSIIYFNETLHRDKICVYTNSENIEEYFSDVEYRLRKKFFMSDEMTLNFNVVFVSESQTI